MKICRILYTYSPDSLGGADIRAEKISKELEKRNHPTVIITIKPTRGETVEKNGKTKIYRLYPFNVSTLHNIGKASVIKQGIWTLLDIYSYYVNHKIRRILKRESPDVVHLHTPVDLTLSAVTAVKQMGLPLVYTLHDYYLLCRRFTLLHKSGRLCAGNNINPLCRIYMAFTRGIINERVDVVIAPSQFILDMHKKYGFFKACRAVVLPHGIEPVDINYPKHKTRNNLNILYVGGLTKQKGIHVLIDAFKQIKNKNIKLHIVGYGVYEKKLKHLAGTDNRIIFHGRFPNEDVHKFYNMADVLVVPSIWYEVRGNVIPEAFRAGIPVVASRIGGIPESIRDDYNGFLFDPGDIKQLKTILDNIIRNPERLKELGANAQTSVKKYDMSEYIQKLSEVYEEAIRINKMRKKGLKV